jgi:hypothetical protein
MLKSAASRSQSTGLIIAIQPKKKTNKRLKMEEIFSLASRHQLSPYAFVLSPGYKDGSHAIDLTDIRTRLASSPVHLQAINAKRFSHINASIIRDTAGLF